MARVALCDRCGAVIRTLPVKQVRFAPNLTSNNVYDVCDKCYHELEEHMKINKEEHNA